MCNALFLLHSIRLSVGSFSGPRGLQFHGPSIPEVPINEMHCYNVKGAGLGLSYIGVLLFIKGRNLEVPPGVVTLKSTSLPPFLGEKKERYLSCTWYLGDRQGVQNLSSWHLVTILTWAGGGGGML